MALGKVLGSWVNEPTGKAFSAFSTNAPSFDTAAYDALNVSDARDFITDDNRDTVLEYERATKNRAGVLNAVTPD